MVCTSAACLYPLPTMTHDQIRGDDHMHYYDDFLQRVELGSVRLTLRHSITIVIAGFHLK